MINIHYSKDYKTYTFWIGSLLADFPSITFKFDTGANYSVINVSSLFPSIDLAERTILYVKELTDKKKCISGSFRSVSGNSTDGILCYVPNFRFNEESSVFNFYFYLIISTAYKKALLGVDFISCCDFSYEVGKDIIIEKFHDSRYKSALRLEEKEKAVSVSDLFKAIQTPAIITRHQILKKHFGTTTLKDFIEKVNEPDSLDSLDFENSENETEDSINEIDSSDSKLKKINAFQ